MQHGLPALEINDAKDLMNSPIVDFKKQLSSLGKDDVAAMFWTANNWGKWIDHNRDDPEAIAQLIALRTGRLFCSAGIKKVRHTFTCTLLAVSTQRTTVASVTN